MIPNINILTEEITETKYPNRTYKIEIEANRINGYTDEVDALKQAIYLILSVERYQHIIYSWDYGVELLELFGKPMTYVIAELPRRIKEALTQDNRIDDVTDFEFEHKGKRLHTTFNVVSNEATFSVNLEVDI